MRVTRLEVFGFKSFMERLVLPLEGGMTGVVGPNGCGKSNIVDALRWVLGETRASNLRGDVLEDVIFNGTDKLRPLGLAEVSITLRAEKENFFEDLLTPQAETELAALLEQLNLERLTSEETPVNGDGAAEPQTAPDTAPGEAETRKVAHLTVIQGSLGSKDSNQAGAAHVDNVGLPPAIISELSANTEGSSNQIDLGEKVEAETPSGSDESQRVSVGERASSALLARFSWLKSANEVQITRRLYRSGESEFFINRVPCRLKDIKDLLRAVGLGPRSYTIVAQGEVSRIITARPEDRRLIIEEAAGVLGLRDRVGATKRRLEETRQNLARLTDVIGEVSRQVGSLKRQAARAEARAEIKQRISFLDQALFAEKLSDFQTRIAAKEQSVQQLKSQEEAARTKLQTMQAQEESARGTLLSLDVTGDSLRAKIDSIREELNSRARARYERTSRISELKASASAKGEEIKRLEERLTQLAQREEDAKKEVIALGERFRTLSDELGQIERGDDESLRQGAANLAQSRESLRAKEQDLRQVREKAIAMRSSLEEIEKQIVSLSPLTQLQKTLGQQGSEALNKIRASTTLFADALKVPDKFARAVQSVLAERSAFLLSDNPHGVAKDFIEGPLQDPRIKRAGLGIGVLKSGQANAFNQLQGVPFTPLLTVVEVREDARTAADRLLGGVFVADTLSEATTFFEQHRFEDLSNLTIVTLNGEILTDVSFFTLPHEGGIIQFRNRAEEIRSELSIVEGNNSRLQAEREQQASAVAAAEERHRTALRESQERQAQARQLANEQGSAKGRLDAAERLVTQIRQDTLRANEQMQSARARISQIQVDQTRLEAELAEITEDGESELKAELTQLNGEYSQLEPVRKESRQKLAQASQGLEEARRALDQLRNLISQGTLDQQRLELEIGNINERILSEYGEESRAQALQVASTGPRLTPADKAAYTDEVEKLKARVIREGEVDPTSIEQYQIEKTRLDELEGQRNDLNSAIGTLEQTVEQLTTTSQERFLATFNAVRENFSRLIPRLFGGGKGSLELSDPDRPLESGVEIVARPPGKKLKSIELMSGGEKALCATGLIFSMFLVRPSPLCVLDEVDAPLDDANLVRLLSLIKEMSARTQFIMITHNKQSMSAASNLVGVTMQEPGATRIITVSLQEAFKQIA